LRRIVGLSSELRDNATDAGHVFWWLPYDNAVGINNLYKFSIHDQDFGYAGRTRFCKFMLLGSSFIPSIFSQPKDTYGSWERVRAITFEPPSYIQSDFNTLSTCASGPQIQSNFQMAPGKYTQVVLISTSE
jgi:hypothetical protein